MSKIGIYFVHNVGHAEKQSGVNYLSGKIRSILYATRLATKPEILSREDMLQTDISMDNNDIWLSIDGTNYEYADIHIIGARIDVKKQNTIVATPLVNRAGKVKERIQENDYEVTISGNLYTDESDKFPYKLLLQLNTILTSANSIYVASAFLDIFEIAKLAFKEADFNQSTLKFFNVMPFTLKFDSDRDYNFLVDEN
jgi:hypothetical protein